MYLTILNTHLTKMYKNEQKCINFDTFSTANAKLKPKLVNKPVNNKLSNDMLKKTLAKYSFTPFYHTGPRD